MAINKEYDDVQLDVKFTQASTRANLVSEENISVSFGKLAKWHEALVPSGGSSGQFLGWNSDGTAKWVSNPNSDTKVTDTVGTANTYYPAGLTGTSTATGTQVFDTAFKFIGTTGTTSAVGKAQLVLGNSTASGTANNKQGSLVVYGSTSYAHTIQGAPTAGRTLTLPDKTGTFALTSDIPSVPTVNDAALTLKGAGTTVTTFTANASSPKSLDIVGGSNVTVTADATNSKISIASSHPTITKSTDTTSTASPAHGGTFTTVDSVTRDANGHVTKINTKTVTLPADSNTDTLVSQTFATASNKRPLLMSYYKVGEAAGTAQVAYRNDSLYCNPSNGRIFATGFYTGGWDTSPAATSASLQANGLVLRAIKTYGDGHTLDYNRYVVRTYSGKTGLNSTDFSSNGMLVTVEGGGLTIIGGGESASSLANLISDDYYPSTGDATSLDVNGDTTTGTGYYHTSLSGSSESLILSSDVGIYFATNCNTIAQRRGAYMSADLSFYPMSTNTGSIGTSTYQWNTIYGKTLYENGTSLASKYAAIGHTHTTTIAVDSGTNQLTLAASTKYKLTAGETNFIFTTPPNTTYSAGTGLSLSGTTFNHSNSVTSVTSAVFKKITYDAQGHITGTANVTASDIPSLDYSKVSISRNLTSGTKVGTITIDGTPTDLYCQTNTNTTYTLSGAYGSSSNTWVTTLTPSSGTATTSTVPTASTSVYGITKLSSSTSSTSTTLAATPSAVKSAYDLANGKSTVSFSASLTTGTKVGTITIDGTATNLYCQTNTNTTYTFATGDAVGQFKVTPSGGSATNYNVNGIAAGTTSGTAKHLAYYDSATSITSAGNIVYSVEDSTASTPKSRTILHIFGNTVGNDASALISGTKGVLSYGDGGPQINFSTSGTIGGTQDSAIIWTDNDSAATGASWHFVSSQTDWNVISKRFHARTGISIGTNLPQTSYNLYVNGTAFHSDSITFGSTTTSVSPALSIYTRTSSNYNAMVRWSNGSTWGTYGAEIGYHNSGGDTTNPGTICILPYQTTTEPWNGQVGLFIKKDHVYIDGVELSKSDHTHSNYVLKTGDTMSGNLSIQKSSEGTYYYAERTDTGVKVGFGISSSNGTTHGIYSNKLGAWMIAGDATNVSVRAVNYNPSTEASLYALPLFGDTPSTGLHALYNNNGFRYSTLQGTTAADGIGIARLVLGNGTASGSAGNKEGSIRLYSESSSYIDLVPASTTSAKTLTLPAVTATVAVSRKSIATDSNEDYASYAWHKFAEVTITSTNYDYVATFIVSSGFVVSNTYPPKKLGILTMHIRTGSSRVYANGEFEWLVAGSQIDPKNFVMVYKDTANTSCKVELWYKQVYRYEGYTFNIIDEHTRTVKNIYTMTLNDTSGHGSSTYTAGTGTIISKLGKIKNAPGIYAVKGTQTASTSVWTGNIDISELYDGLTIAYYLPYSATSTLVTLNLTLADGTTTGAINCYYTNASRITTHYAAGSTIILTYWSAGSISVGGTATTDNRWTRCDYNANSNVTQNFATGNTNRPLLMSYYAKGNTTTSAQVVYRNDTIYANPSTGTISCKNLTLGTPYTVDAAGSKGTLTLYQNASGETLPCAIIEPEAGVAGSDSTIKIPTSRSGVVRLEETVYESPNPSAGTAISNLSFSYGIPRYVKVCARVGSSFAGGVTNIFDIQLNTSSGNGVMLTWGTPGQYGTSTYILYANVRIVESSSKYTINFVTGSPMLLSVNATPTSVSAPSIFIYEIIAVY